MKKDIQTFIETKKNNFKTSQKWKKIVSGLSCIAIFLTLYSLMTPAITENTVVSSTFHLIDGYDYEWKANTETIIDDFNDDINSEDIEGLENTEEQKISIKPKYTTSYDLKLYFMDTDGNYIQGQDITLNLGVEPFNHTKYGFGDSLVDGEDLIKLLNLYEYTLSTGEKYEFDHVEVSLDGNSWTSLNSINSYIWCENSNSDIEPEDYGWRGTYSDNTNYTITENTEYKFVYKLIRQGTNTNEKIKSIAKSNNSRATSLGADSGIKFNMFDYSGDNTNSSNFENINDNGVYNFFTFRGSNINGSSRVNTTIDADGFTDNRIRVLPTLDANGYPVFDCRGYTYDRWPYYKCNNFSLGYLFGSNTNPEGKRPKGVTSYDAQNTLLQKETVNGIEYYYYDSNKNAVDYDTENNYFMVRDYVERTRKMTTYQNESNRYEFKPFNYWTDDQTIKYNNYKPYNYEDSEAEHWYGMTMEFTFYMPKNGKINNNDMIFEFSGDDDVWVFIDNVLVLDLGGTHGSVDGSINFSTGVVQSQLNWNGGRGTLNTTSISKAFEDANATNNVTWNNNIFSDYSKHTIKFFYLERGASVANCKIRFNMPVLPSGSLSVQKQFEGINNFPDDEYEFTLYDVTSNAPVANATYTINGVSNTTDSNGKFKLKNTQTAIFNLINGHSYYVEETNPGNHATLHSCTLDGVRCQDMDGNEAMNKTGTITIGPSSTYLAIFTNTTNVYNLDISKIAYNSSPEEQFEFKLNLKDSSGSPIDMTNINFTDKFTVDYTTGIVTFSLVSGETIKLEGIPLNTRVTLQETKHDGYQTIIKKTGEDYLLSNGDMYEFIMDSNKDITVHNIPGVVLPDTGGSGIFKQLFIGLSLILISIKFGYSYFLKLKEGGEQ